MDENKKIATYVRTVNLSNKKQQFSYSSTAALKTIDWAGNISQGINNVHNN